MVKNPQSLLTTTFGTGTYGKPQWLKSMNLPPVKLWKISLSLLRIRWAMPPWISFCCWSVHGDGSRISICPCTKFTQYTDQCIFCRTGRKTWGGIVEKRVKNELLKNENKRIGYWITENKRNWKNALLTSLACSISSGSKKPSKYESATSGEYGDPVQYCSYSTMSCFFCSVSKSC